MSYKYIAVDENGKKVSGIIKDKSKKESLKELSLRNFTVMSIENTSTILEKNQSNIPVFLKKRISREEKIILHLQFSNLLSANLSILETLQIMQEQTKKNFLKNGLSSIRKDIEKGKPIFEAFEGSGLFDELTVNMIKAGEESSRLNHIFMRLSVFSEREFNMIQNIKSILAYPIILFFMGGLLTLITMTFVFPKFVEIFEQGEIALPLITRIVAYISHLLISYWYIFVAAAAACFIFLQNFISKEKGKLFLSRLSLKIPFIRDLIAKIEFSRFLYCLQLLLGSGVDIIDSIEYSKGTLTNRLYKKHIDNIKIEIQKGKSLTELLKESPYFPEIAIRMITVGEKTGELEPFLEKAASYLEVMFNYQVKRVIVFIEPTVLAAMGLFVGLLMASFILPLFRIVHIRR